MVPFGGWGTGEQWEVAINTYEASLLATPFLLCGLNGPAVVCGPGVGDICLHWIILVAENDKIVIIQN